jgi:hypothetical protein
MTIDPRWSIGLSLLIALLGYAAGIGSQLTDAGLDPTSVKHLLSWIGILSGLLATINAVLTGIPSKDNKTGFLVKGPDRP